MSRSADEQRITRLLACPEFREQAPPADDAYWQARVRLVLHEEQRRRQNALRPMRTLHIAAGLGVLATGLALVPFSPALGLFAGPSILTAVALGARLLFEAPSGQVSHSIGEGA
ncbi:hypothetical protein ABI59_16895 [Acidobacteria bacterium Mor1]|nr:hypothetical protein ABI59_16895 [Acidobacteria bacterium Mor1]